MAFGTAAMLMVVGDEYQCFLKSLTYNADFGRYEHFFKNILHKTALPTQIITILVHSQCKKLFK